jgi:membrane-associated phospholipid phosphatase
MTFGEEHHVGGRDLTEWRTRVGQLLAAYGTRLAAVLGPHVALVVTLVVSAALVTTFTAASAEIYEQVEDGDGVASFDRPLLRAVAAVRTPGWNDLVTAYTDLGGPVGMPVLATLAVLAMTLAWRQWTPLVLMLAATAGSLAMTVVGKAVVGRTRPPSALAVPPFEDSASFPSGHSLNAVVVTGVSRVPARAQAARRLGPRDDPRRSRRPRHGAVPRLPRAPLAHRRPGRLDPGPGLAAARRRGAPAVPHGPAARTEPGGRIRSPVLA